MADFRLVGCRRGSGGSAGLGAGCGACGRTGRRYAGCIDPGFLRHLGPSDLARFRAAASGPRPGDEPVAPRTASSNVYELVGDYTNPILKPQAAEVVKKHGEISLTGVPYPTPSNQCWPGGVPFVLWNIGMQMLQQPDKITILYSNDHEVRHVRMNQPHPAQVTPSWYGDSVGHYEGDTLVIDTVGVKSGPFAMVDMYGTPHSPALHVVERYRLLDYEAAKEAEERGQRELTRIPGSRSGLCPQPRLQGQGAAARIHRRG